MKENSEKRGGYRLIIKTQNTIALLCPNCGRLSWHVLSLFSLTGQKKSFVCECGTPVLAIEKKKGHYWFQTDCAFCGIDHLQSFTRKETMATTVREICCPEADCMTGCLGPQEKVKQHLKTHRRSLTQLAREVGSSDYFENPEVMFGILERLYEMAQTGELCCDCGNQNLELEIFPKELDLRCQECGVEMRVPALLPDDLGSFLKTSIGSIGSLEIDQRRQRRQKKLRIRKHIKSQLE